MSTHDPDRAPSQGQVASDALITVDFCRLVMAHLLQALAYASMLLLPLYLRHLGARHTVIGVVMATAAVSGLLFRPAVGWLLDRWGRKPTLIVSTLIVAVAMGLLAFVDRIGPLIYLQRAILGIGLGGLFAGYFTFAADLIPASRRTEGLALFGVSGLLPLLVNPLSDQLSLSPADLRWFLPCVGIAVALSLLFLWPLKEPKKANAEKRGTFNLKTVTSALKRKPLQPVWLATIIFSSLVAVFMTFTTVTAEARGVERPASLWFSYAIGAATVRLFGGRVPDRIGPRNMVTPAIGLYIVGVFIAAEASDFRDFLIAALCAGVGHGYCFPVLTTQVVTRTAVSFRGSALAMFTALWGLSELVISPTFGLIADHKGEQFMFWFAGAISLGALIVWIALEHLLGGEEATGAARKDLAEAQEG